MPKLKKRARIARNNAERARKAKESRELLRRHGVTLRQDEDSIREPEGPPPPQEEPPAPKEKNEVCIFCAEPTCDIPCDNKREIFRRVLGVSEQKLQGSRASPPYGRIMICGNCAPRATEGLECFKQIEILQNKLKNAQEFLKRKVQTSTKTFNKTKQNLRQPQLMELYQRVRNSINGIIHEPTKISVPPKKHKPLKRLLSRRKQNLASSSTTYAPLSPLDLNCMDFDNLPEVETEIAFHSNSTYPGEDRQDPLAFDNLLQPLALKCTPIVTATATSEPSPKPVAASELPTKPTTVRIPKSAPECSKSMPQIAAAIVSKSQPKLNLFLKPVSKLPKELERAVKYELADQNGKFWCRICKEKLDTALEVVQHRKFIHPDLAICTGLPNLACLKIFRATELKRHKKEQHALFHCDVENCVHSFSSHFFKIIHYFEKHPKLPLPSPEKTKNVENFVKPVSEEEIGRIVTPRVLLDNNSVIKEESLGEMMDLESCLGEDFENFENLLRLDNEGGSFVVKDEIIDEEMEVEQSFNLEQVDHFEPEACSLEIEDGVDDSNFEKAIETDKNPEFSPQSSKSFSRFPENLEENVSESQQNLETDEKDEESPPNSEIENEIVDEKSPVPEFLEKSLAPATEPLTKSITKSNISENSISESMSQITAKMTFNSKPKTYLQNKTTKPFQKSFNIKQFSIIQSQKSDPNLAKSIPFNIEFSQEKLKINRLVTIPSISPPRKQEYQKCGLCRMPFESASSLVTHLKSKHASACVFECDICKRRFDTETQLQLHMTSQHLKPLKTYPGKKVLPRPPDVIKPLLPPFGDLNCSTCDKQFLDIEEFCNHSHKLPKSEIFATFLCDVEGCGKSFKERSSLRAHQAFSHKMTNIPYECTFCGQNCGTYKHLREHVTIHTGINSYKCKKCPATFPNESQLRRHLLKEHVEDPYRWACNLCPKKFSHSGKLKNHRATHFDERPFLCWECGKTFKTHNNLYIHRWSHDPDRKTKYSPYMKNQRKGKEATKRRKTKKEAENKSVPSSTVTSEQVQELQVDEIQDQNQSTPENCLILVQSNQNQANEF